MTAWTNDELDKIAAAEELEIASLRRDGTLRKAVTIWVSVMETISTSARRTGAPPAGFAVFRTATRVTSVPAASTMTSASSKPTTASMISLTPPTAPSTAVTPPDM